MSIKAMRKAVRANGMMSNLEVKVDFYTLLYSVLGMSEEVIAHDLADASEEELDFIFSCFT